MPALGLRRWRRGAHLQEQLLVDGAGFSLSGNVGQLAGDVHEGAWIALSVLAKCRHQFRRHQLGEAPWAELRKPVDDFLASYDVPAEYLRQAAE